ncbi:hypothetical protein LUZ60_003810 [Juncus effusus]|nr:hypothetical protein LUZ60_003810 [Juncus effusus]
MSEKMQRKAKPRGDEEVYIDLRDLLVSCANALVINDRKIAHGLIKEIRKHASLNGDGTQRLAFFFVNALEARLAGSGSEKGEIIKLRITGVDFPQAGFRPAERVEEIGKKLKNYAETFNVPFEYQGIASNWEEICIKDLKIEKDEVLIVNTLFQFRRVKDETFGYDKNLSLVHFAYLCQDHERHGKDGNNKKPEQIDRGGKRAGRVGFGSGQFGFGSIRVSGQFGSRVVRVAGRSGFGSFGFGSFRVSGHSGSGRGSVDLWSTSYSGQKSLRLVKLSYDLIISTSLRSIFTNQMAEAQYTDPIFNYISQILFEEEMDENFNGHQETPNLHEIEKPFYDILEQKYPPNYPKRQPISTQLEANFDSTDSPSKSSTQESGIESSSNLEFRRGVEEGMKFLPIISKLVLDLQTNTIESDIISSNLKLGEKESRGNKGKKNGGTNMDLLEVRNRKLSMLCYEEPIRNDTFDQALLYHGENYEREEISSLHETMRSRANPRGDKENHIDLSDLLVSCSSAIAINDHKIAYSLIKEIRKHSSPNGDGTQRMAFAFVNALEARLAGSGSESYRYLVSKRISTTDTLKSYHLFIKASPFCRVSYCFASNVVLHAMNKSSKIHIIDLGIGFGFQWPSLIQSIANNRKSISKLRMTGVDFPQAGFRPAERIEENGRRLRNYAESFNVPFEYQGIASKWEDIRIEDLKIEKDEVLIVNSMYQFRRVKDETFGLDSPRNQVLNLIRRINPRIFIQGVFNATYSPFFVTRFRQVLSHYSSVFDILDSRVPRDYKYRELAEQGFLACDIMNIVACEGSDWMHRPETYKQWHVRNLRAGFEPVPIEPDIVKVCKEKVRNFYDNRFFIEKDGNWLLQGWRGRVNYGLSVWKPKLE